MIYGQETVAVETELATGVMLRIDGQWLPGRLLDKDGKLMSLPCEVKAGEHYIIEVELKRIVDETKEWC